MNAIVHYKNGSSETFEHIAAVRRDNSYDYVISFYNDSDGPRVIYASEVISITVVI